MAQDLQFQQKANQLTSFRPIAPSQPTILPRPETKRKWDDTQELFSKNRRSSNSSHESPNDQRSRRKEQNRAAQRAFRERKEKYVKELEDKIKAMEMEHARQIAQLETENQRLKQELLLSKQQDEKKEKVVTVPSSPPSHSPATPHTSAVACIRDKDGVSFCERLKEEVCSNAYKQLLTEPLFDEFGILNETVSDHPVPIVTNSDSKSDMFFELEQYLNEKFSSSPHESASVNSQVDLISCSEVWKQFSNHPSFEKFNKDDLCDRLRQIAKCSQSGPVFDDREVQAVMEFMLMKLEEQADIKMD